MQCFVIWDQSEGKFIRFNDSTLHKPDETDNEFRTDVIAIEFISQSGDHILIYLFILVFMRFNYVSELLIFVSFLLEFTCNFNS